MDADFIGKEELEQIMNERGDACVSIYLPMTRVGTEVQGNRIQLKNALDDVEKELRERGWRKPQIDDLLEQPRKLLNDSPFWQHQLDGLALFISANSYETYRLPLHFEPLLLVGQRFHIKPLLPLFSDDGRFYILALSQDNVRLFQGTRSNVDEIELQGVPRSLAEALSEDDPEAQLQHHTTTTAAEGRGGPGVVHHGHGVTDDEEKQRLRRYLQMVSKGVEQRLKQDQAPLVLAAVDYLHPIYKGVDSSPHVLDEGISGNPEHLSAKELHEQAWEIVEPIFKEAKDDVARRYKELEGSEQASDELAQIVPAAFQGRVDALFVALKTQEWGTYNPETNSIYLHDARQNGDEDLLDFAALQTLANGGTVYAVSSDEIPGTGSAAAVFRF